MNEVYTSLLAFTFIFCFIITALSESRLIPFLKKRAKQPIYKEGPAWHLSKEGTPTMGGIAFIISAFTVHSSLITVFFLSNDLDNALSLLLSLIFCLYNAFIGLADDLTKLKRKHNAGLTPIEKLSLQTVGGALFLVARHFVLDHSTKVYTPFFSIELGLFYFPIMLFIILGIVNCANLTDGIDGLASSTAFAAGTSFLLFFISKNIVSSVIAVTLISISVAFLIFNLHPAKIFMGDTGSLFLGALAVSCAFSSDEPILVIPISTVFVIEGCSVILQVLFYKLTRKRLFKMAPIHHHLEKSGISENKICVIAIVTTLLVGLLTFLIWR